jgi:hypothetical protein
VVLDLRAEPGTRNTLDVAVLPAEAGSLMKDAASLGELMKGVRPAGRWTLEVYER